MSENGNIFARGCLVLTRFRFWGASKRLSKEQMGDLPDKIVTATRSLLRNRSYLETVNEIGRASCRERV